MKHGNPNPHEGAGHCEIDKARRNWCPRCRLIKCLQVNMNKEGGIATYFIFHFMTNLKKSFCVKSNLIISDLEFF